MNSDLSICKICGRDLKSRLGIHITRTHKMSLEDYYLLYIGERGKCLTCGKYTNFIGLTRGYYNFCSNACVGNNKNIQQQKTKTTQQHFGVDFPLQSKEVRKKCETTLQNRYGCSNSYNIEPIKQKAQKNSHTVEANVKRRKHVKQTKHEKMLDPTYLNSIIAKTKETNQQRYGKDWAQLTVEGKEKIRKSVCKLFETDTTYKQRLKAKYMYNDIPFDSSYELAYYIYAIDHNEQIVRCPCKFNYTKQNGKSGTYIPDFLHKGQLIEIKGDCFFDDEGNLFNFYDNTSLQDKYNCMVTNDVKILRKQDIIKQINYCKQKFQSGRRWYRQFQTKNM